MQGWKSHRWLEIRTGRREERNVWICVIMLARFSAKSLQISFISQLNPIRNKIGKHHGTITFCIRILSICLAFVLDVKAEKIKKNQIDKQNPGKKNLMEYRNKTTETNKMNEKDTEKQKPHRCNTYTANLDSIWWMLFVRAHKYEASKESRLNYALLRSVFCCCCLCCSVLLAFHLGCRGPSALTRHRTTIHHTANKGGISGWIQFARLVACIENLQWFGCSAHILSVCVENLPCYPPHLWMGAHQKPIALDIYYSVWYFMFFSCLLNMFGMQQHFRTHDYGKELQPRKRHTRSQRYLIMICYSMLLMRGQYAREQNNNRVKRNS